MLPLHTPPLRNVEKKKHFFIHKLLYHFPTLKGEQTEVMKLILLALRL